jgi:hypothetical protein
VDEEGSQPEPPFDIDGGHEPAVQDLAHARILTTSLAITRLAILIGEMRVQQAPTVEVYAGILTRRAHEVGSER